MKQNYESGFKPSVTAKSHRTAMSRLLLMTLLLFAFLGGAKADEITVYDGDATNSKIPVNGLYVDTQGTTSEFIIPAETDGMSDMIGGTITKLTFYIPAPPASWGEPTIQLYMGEVDGTTLSSINGPSNFTVVATGVWDNTKTTIEIELDDPFVYNGGNLLIGTYVLTASSTYKSANFAGVAAESGASIYNNGSGSGTAQSFLPKTTFEYTPGSGTSVERPTTFTVSNVTAYEATLAWSGGTGTYNLELKEADGEFEELEYGTTATSLVLDELAPNTAYTARIQSVDGSEVSGWKTVSFKTKEVCPDGKVCIGEGTATNSYLPSNNYYKYSLTQQIYTAEELGEEGYILSLDLFKSSTNEMIRNLDIYVVSTDKKEFDSNTDWIPVSAADLVFSGEVTFTNNDWTTIEFENPFEYNGDSNIAIIIDDNTGSYKSSTPFYAFATEKSQALYYATDSNNPDPTAVSITGNLASVKNRIRLAIGEPPAVLKPTGLTVNYTGGLTAEISWTSDESAFDISVNDVVTENVSNPYTLENLDLATVYEVKVRAKNDEGESDWTAPVSFTTDMCMPEDQCVITLALTDSYGDGWNGAYIDVVDVATGASLGTFANQNTSKVEDKEKEAKEKEAKIAAAKVKGAKAEATTQIYTLAVCKDREIQFAWHAGNYDSECSFVIYDVNEEEIVSGNSSVLPYNYTVDCAVVNARKPTNLAASEIAPRSAKLSWTENSVVPATEWVLAYKTDGDFTEVNVTVNPFVLEGLTPETAYTVKVRPETGEGVEKWSDELTFTTDVLFPAPTALAVNEITSTSASISWTGIADSYNLRYMETEAPSMATIILNADDVWDDGSGYQMLLDADATAFGTIIPETGPLTSSGDADASVYAEFEYKIPENADGALTTINMVCNASVSIQIPAGTYDWCITNPTPNDKMWIASAGGTIGGRYDDYVFEAGKTYEFHVYNGGQNDATDLTITDSKAAPAKDGEWTVVENVTSPYTIEGLTPETYYAVEVQGVYTGEDEGESTWTAKGFTTDIAFPAPKDLTADNITSSTAEISWTADPTATGAELQYAEGSFISDATWKMYDNGTMGTTIYANGSAFDYGVMIPTGSYNGNTLTKVSLYDAASARGTITIYNDGTTAPENAIASKSYTLTGAEDFVEVDFDGVTLDNTKNVWVVVSNPNGASVAAAVDDLDDANGRWVSLSEWQDLASAGVPGYCWMVRAEIGTAVDLSTLTWTTVADATSPQELTGLSSNTDYIVKVKSIYGTEGESEWTTTSFKTLDANPVPYDIAADLVADGATITWKGEGESYNVQYRTAANTEVFFYDDFENGLGNWTIYTEGGAPYEEGWIPYSFDEGASYFATSWSFVNSVGAFAADNWLITPQVDLKGTLAFWVASVDTSYPDSYEVKLSTTDNEIASFTTELQAMTAAEGWNQVVIDLSNYAGQKGYIAIHHVSEDKYCLAIDDFGIFGETTEEGEWQNMAVNDPTVTLSGLATNNAYEYQIQSVKGGETSEWSEAGEFALLTLQDNATNTSLLLNNLGRQAHVTLANRTLFQDGNWNTLTLPFDIDDLDESPLAGATAKTLTGATIEGSTVTMHFDEYPIYAGVPYIIKWESGSGITNPEFANVVISAAAGYTFGNENVQFTGYFDPIEITADDEDIYYMVSGSELKRTGVDRTLKPFRGYFKFTEEAATARQFVLDFGDGEVVTGIEDIQMSQNTNSWYNVNGVKLNGKPSRKGLYIQNGQKVVIK